MPQKKVGRTYPLKISSHVFDGYCFRASDLSLEQLQKIRAIVTNQYMPSQDYRLANACTAFLESYQEPENGENGFILVSLGFDKEKSQALINHINKALKLRL